MKPSILIKAIAILSMGIWSVPSYACSIIDDYIGPSNYELVQLADGIIIATAIQEQSHFSVDFVLKGQNVPKTLRLNIFIGNTSPSDPELLISSHPDDSMCNRYSVAKGKQYVLFLKRNENGKFEVFDYHPFTRIIEDYYGDQSIWMKAITYYLSVQNNFDPMKQLDVLKDKYQELNNDPKTVHDQLLAVDIAYHLISPSPYKPLGYLKQAYETIGTGEPYIFKVEKPKKEFDNKEIQGFSWSMFGFQDHDPSFGPTTKDVILKSIAIGDYPNASSFMKNIVTSGKPSPSELGAIIQYMAHHGEYETAVGMVKKHTLTIVGMSKEREVSKYLQGVSNIHYNPDNPETPKWQLDPELKEWWPQFSFSISQLRTARFSKWNEFSWLGERPTNYRENPKITMALAQDYDEDVVKWAKDEIDRLVIEKVKTFKSDYALPIEIILEDYSYDNTEYVDKLFCQSNSLRYLLVKHIAIHQGTYSSDLLIRFAAFTGYNKEQKSTLLKSISAFAGMYQMNTVTKQRYSGYYGAFDLLKALMNDEPVDLKENNLKPIMCE